LGLGGDRDSQRGLNDEDDKDKQRKYAGNGQDCTQVAFFHSFNPYSIVKKPENIGYIVPLLS
jgi:hypothetical protein